MTTYLEQLKEDGCPIYWSMFVPVGYGKRNSLDYTLCIQGWFVGIETKAPGEDLTPLQRQTCRDMLRSGGKVFIISGEEGLNAFKRWVEDYVDMWPE